MQDNTNSNENKILRNNIENTIYNSSIPSAENISEDPNAIELLWKTSDDKAKIYLFYTSKDEELKASLNVPSYKTLEDLRNSIYSITKVVNKLVEQGIPKESWKRGKDEEYIEFECTMNKKDIGTEKLLKFTENLIEATGYQVKK